MESSGRQLSKNTKYAIVHALLGKKVRYQPVGNCSLCEQRAIFSSWVWKGLGLQIFFCKVTKLCTACSWYALLVDCCILLLLLKLLNLIIFTWCQVQLCIMRKTAYCCKKSLEVTIFCIGMYTSTPPQSYQHIQFFRNNYRRSFIFNLHLSRKKVFQCLTKLYHPS